MQKTENNLSPLPWRADNVVSQENKADDILSANHKVIATLWGGDHPSTGNNQWVTFAQRQKHLKYILHVCNHFPNMQKTLCEIYDHPGMPDSARQIINRVLTESHCKEMPSVN